MLVPIIFIALVFAYISFITIVSIDSRYNPNDPPSYTSVSKRTLSAMDFQNLTTHYGMFHVSRWLRYLDDKVQIIPPHPNLTADLVFYEAEGDGGAVINDVSFIMSRKPNTTLAIFILTGDDMYVPDYCANRNSSIFYVTHPNKESNCFQVEITYYTIMGRADPHRAVQGRRIGAGLRRPRENRDLLANFVGSSWTYPPRAMFAYYNRSADMFIRFNEEYWIEPQRGAYYYSVRNVSYSALERSVFTLTPRGRGLSSMRLVEAIFMGSIPVMLDDHSTPFGQSLDFAVRRSFPPQNLSEPLTRATKAALFELYEELRSIATSSEELRWRRGRMLEFYRDYLVPDLRHPKYWRTYPHFPLATRLWDDIDRQFVALSGFV